MDLTHKASDSCGCGRENTAGNDGNALPLSCSGAADEGQTIGYFQNSRMWSRIVKAALTVIVAIVAFYRQPELLMEPRFWAEEGANYFSYAFTHSWNDNLLHPQFGYNTLYNSIVTSLAASVPLEHAPYVTTWIAFFVQLFVSAMVIYWDIPMIQSLWKKFIIALSIQYLAYARIWVTTIGVQYWLCVLTFLILLSETGYGDRWRTYSKRSLLVLNGLTGVLSCFMIPAFILKWLRTKNREVLIQAAILTTCLAVQLGVYLYALLNSVPGMTNRMTYCAPSYMIAKLLRFEFVAPFFGQRLGEYTWVQPIEIWLRDMLFHVFGQSIYHFQFHIFEQLIGVAIILYLAVVMVKTIKETDTQTSILSLLLVSVLSTLFSINMSGGPRYTFAPSVMIMIIVAGTIGVRKIPGYLQLVAVLLLASSIIFSEYRSVMGGFAYDPSWPKWEMEAAIWKVHPQYMPKIWPPPWSMTLGK